jgi:hypothetical protein
MRSILSKATTGAMIAGAALLVAACGGGAGNNTANASNTAVGTEPAPLDNSTSGMPADNTMPPADNSGMAPGPVDAGNGATGNATNEM